MKRTRSDSRGWNSTECIEHLQRGLNRLREIFEASSEEEEAIRMKSV